jgi:hypothetical protein
MIKVSAATLSYLEDSPEISFKAIVYFQEPETYTPGDYLAAAGDISWPL